MVQQLVEPSPPHFYNLWGKNVFASCTLISVSWFCDHTACNSLGGRIGTDAGCAGCRRRVERTVECEEHAHSLRRTHALPYVLCLSITRRVLLSLLNAGSTSIGLALSPARVCPLIHHAFHICQDSVPLHKLQIYYVQSNT